MKKIVFALILISCILVSGCEQVVRVVDKDGNVIKQYSTAPGFNINPHCTVEVEDCEYFKIYAHGSYTYVHKGNCKNPIHIHNGGNHE